MLQKIADIIEMTFAIPETEKKIAHQVIEKLQNLLTILKRAADHLDIIYVPFKEHNGLDAEQLQEKGGLISRFKDKLKENYEEILNSSFEILKELNYFNKDTGVAEISTSFKNEIGELKLLAEGLMDDLDDLDQVDFQNTIIEDFENIKKSHESLQEFIEERMINHIMDNILAETWIQNVEDKLHSKIEDKIPLVIQLYNEREQAINGVPQIAKRPQALNPALQQRMWYPTDARQADSDEPHEDLAHGHQ